MKGRWDVQGHPLLRLFCTPLAVELGLSGSWREGERGRDGEREGGREGGRDGVGK